MKYGLTHALHLLLAVLILALTLAPARASGGVHLVIRSIPVGILPDALALDAPAHRLYVANSGPQVVSPDVGYPGVPDEDYRNRPGSLSVIDTQTERVVATLPLDVFPQELVLDARRHRLYVLCADALPIQLAPYGKPTPAKSTLDVVDTRTLRIIVRVGIPDVGESVTLVPFYPSREMMLDSANDHLFMQGGGLYDSAGTVASLYDAASMRLLRTYSAPSPTLTSGFFAVQSAASPLLVYTEHRGTAIVWHPRLLQLANGTTTRLHDIIPANHDQSPVFGAGWIPASSEMYTDSTSRRLLELVAYGPEGGHFFLPGPPHTLDIYDLQRGKLLKELVFVAGTPGGQQAVAFDERLGRYYVLGTAPDPRHPVPCAPAINIMTGDLRTGKVVHTTPGKGWLTSALVDPVRHLVYAASGDGVAEGPVWNCTLQLTGGAASPVAGVVQVVDGRTGVTLATASFPSYHMAWQGHPAAQEPGQVAAMTLDPTTGTAYAVDGRGGNAVYAISLQR